LAERTPDSAGATVLHTEPGFLIAAVRDVMLVLWAVRATPDTVLELERASQALIERFGQTATIYVALRDAPLPDESTRRVLEEVASRLAKKVTAVAVVLQGHGFWASAVRAFVTSVRWGGLVTMPYKVHVCSTTEEATRWLVPAHATRSQVAPEAAELDAALLELLAHPVFATPTAR
jgi:predicted nucleic acid-binding Zn ribbon protein